MTASAPKLELTFDGKTLEWAGHGTYMATSGVGASQSPEAEVDANTGPVPEGLYEVSLTIAPGTGYAAVLDVKNEGGFKVTLDKDFEIQKLPTNIEFGDVTARGPIQRLAS